MWGGILLAIGAAACQGSFGVPMRLKAVEDHDITALQFTFWAALGMVASSVLLVPWADISAFQWEGVASGVLVVASMGTAFGAISQLGLGVAAGLWGGTAALASMIWDIRMNPDEASSPDLAAGGVLVTVVGIAAMAVNGRYNEFLNQQREEAAELAVDSEDEDIVLELVEERRLSEDRVMDPLSAEAMKLNRLPSFGNGLVAAVVAGVCTGLVLAPRAFVQLPSATYLANLATGVGISAPVLILALAIIQDGRHTVFPSVASMKVAAPLGIISGVIWNGGIVCSTLAADLVGLAWSLPVSQSGLLVAGVWSIFLFREMALQTVSVYLLSSELDSAPN
mmetsp:Transcript_8229/g.24536  ORF Transcript_8229/g.24536 Transcript_8229/m.24536 type:complete len:338 (-) Transcript_8229:3654-4667(-)